jgi:hypothetical protein
MSVFNLSHFASFSFDSNVDTVAPTLPSVDYYINLNTSIPPQQWISGDYIQDANADLVDVNVRIDAVNLAKVLNTKSFTVAANGWTEPNMHLSTSHGGIYNTGAAFLEFAALRIFGHAAARAAITNDNAYTANAGVGSSLVDAFGAGVANTLLTDAGVNNQIFDMYVPLGKPELNNNDVGFVVPMNLNNTNWQFPVMFTGSLVASTAGISLAAIQNGVVGGVGNMLNGDYNIPVMIKISYQQ